VGELHLEKIASLRAHYRRQVVTEVRNVETKSDFHDLVENTHCTYSRVMYCTCSCVMYCDDAVRVGDCMYASLYVVRVCV